MAKKNVFKIITAGDGDVGKSALIQRYLENTFTDKSQQTIGVDFWLKDHQIDGEDCTLQIWDFGGGERFKFLLGSYVVGAAGALLLFDLTRPETLNGINEWIEILHKGAPNLPILLIGTKSDLGDKIKFQDETFHKIQEAYDIFDLCKVSSKTGENVSEAIEVLLKKILKKDYQHLLRKKQELNYVIDSFINSSTSGYFVIQVEEILNFIKINYDIEFSLICSSNSLVLRGSLAIR